MDFSAFKKPWVIYAGLGIGALILFTKATGNAAPAKASGGQSVDYQAALNAAGMQFMEFNATLAASQSAQNFDHDIKSKAIVASALMQLDQNSTLLSSTIANANAGVTNNLIATRAAVTMDKNQNDARALLYGLVASNTKNNTSGVTPQIGEQNP